MVPARGATKIYFKGVVGLKVGSEEKTEEVKYITQTGKKGIKVGPVEVRKGNQMAPPIPFPLPSIAPVLRAWKCRA
ncbi:hypothetical protein B4Q13_25075 [Lacticaseibacillus rhamnosus]